MKCALVIPPWSPTDIFPGRTVGSQINYWQPLGTLYVASSLLAAGHETRFFNGAFLSEEEIVKGLRRFDPAVVGIYSTAFGWPRAKVLAEEAKRLLPRAFVVAGGPFPIARKRNCLEESPFLDAVVTGEGELTMVEMLGRLAAGLDLADVQGIAYRQGTAVHENRPRPLNTNLDSLPIPARELLGDAGRYIPPPATYRRAPVAVVMTSRGCTRHCIYCFQMDRHRETGIRRRSIRSVMDEIEVLLGQGYREIKFIDDTLAADYDRAMALAGEIRRRRLDFTWFASACANQVDRPLLDAFREAGCWAILIGAESGVQRNLDTLRKGITLDHVRRAVRAGKDAGLTVFTSFVFGIPGETHADGLETIRFACELDPHVANFHGLTPFPGTELYERRDEWGTVSPDWQDYTYQGAAFVPRSLSREEIQSLRETAFRTFYSRPRFLLRRLLGLRTRNDLRAAVSGLKSLLGFYGSRAVFSRPVPRWKSGEATGAGD